MKAVIFDLDGTLADTEPYHSQARNAILNELGISDSSSDRLVGVSVPDFWRNAVAGKGLDSEEITKRNFMDVCTLVTEHKVEPFEGVKELIIKLKSKNYAVCVASSSYRLYVETLLGYWGLSQYIDCVVCGDEIKELKPAPDIYLKVMEKCGLHADECISVEDSDAGSRSAKTAGLYCIGYSSPVAAVKQSLNLCDAKASNYADIAHIIFTR